MASKKKTAETTPTEVDQTTETTDAPKSPTKNKGLAMLRKATGAVAMGAQKPTQNVLRAPTPALRYVFGEGGGIPFGFGTILYGPPKGGKSLTALALVGALHQQDPEAIAVWYSPEMRYDLQVTPEMMAAFGIDPERIVGYNRNEATIFDDIEKSLPEAIANGAKVKLLVIDSLNAIQGVREANRDSIVKQQIGDNARTLQEGAKMILPVIRKYGIAFVGVSQVRAEMDQGEIMRGNTQKMALSYGAKHFAEYFISVSRWLSKEGRQDFSGNAFENNAEETTGHKIVVKNVDSSIGYGGGRRATVTVDYRRGFINHHEETFDLAVRTGIIKIGSGSWYEYKGVRRNGKAAMAKAIQEDTQLADEINKLLLQRDFEELSVKEREQRNDEENDLFAKKEVGFDLH